MKDAPDFLSEEQSSAPETEAKGPLPETAASEAPPAAPAEPQAPLDPAQPADAAPGAHHVPLATFLDFRDRASAAEKEAKELRDWKAQQEARARQQPVPDRNADPEAFEDFRAQQFVSQMRGQAMGISRRFAVMSHGQETVDAAYQWGVAKCDQDPLFNQRVAMSDDPYDLVVSEWKRDQTLTRLGDGDLDAFLAWKAQQAGDPPAQTTTPAPAIRASPAAPRPSLASAPAAGRTSAPEGKDGEATFNGMFG